MAKLNQNHPNDGLLLDFTNDHTKWSVPAGITASTVTDPDGNACVQFANTTGGSLNATFGFTVANGYPAGYAPFSLTGNPYGPNYFSFLIHSNIAGGVPSFFICTGNDTPGYTTDGRANLFLGGSTTGTLAPGWQRHCVTLGIRTQEDPSSTPAQLTLDEETYSGITAGARHDHLDNVSYQNHATSPGTLQWTKVRYIQWGIPANQTLRLSQFWIDKPSEPWLIFTFDDVDNNDYLGGANTWQGLLEAQNLVGSFSPYRRQLTPPRKPQPA